MIKDINITIYQIYTGFEACYSGESMGRKGQGSTPLEAVTELLTPVLPKQWLAIDIESWVIHMDFDTQREAEEYSQGRYIIVELNRVIDYIGNDHFFRSIN
jgi:hypothetical protein